tara:strand:- start:4970 stop:5635 length:666 start_codon:yes stop_codon:yes gene_type:complete
MIRIFDIFFSLLAIIFLSPIFTIISIFLKFSGEGEILYFQERIGKNKKVFKLIKFATMLKNSPNIGTKSITVKGDPRILPMGHFLRKTKINELPQIFNVLFGDISLIGPRPLVQEGVDNYPRELEIEMSKIKPGLSGLASILLRNEEEVLSAVKDPVEFHKKILTPFKAEIEVWMSKKNNLTNYFLLIFLTIWIVLFPRTKILNNFFKDRPKMPDELTKLL